MAGFSLIIMFLLICFIVLLPIYIIQTIGLWAVFKKAGKKGWYSIIPFYNTWVLTEITELDWWYALIIIFSNLGYAGDSYISGLLALAGAVANFFICYNLSKKFEKEVGTAFLIFFFPFIMYPILGLFSDFKYNKNIRVSKNGPIGDSNFKETNSNQNNTNYYEGNYTEKQYCRFCGASINSDAKFCGNCGNKLDN